jgi:hypothetical protein
VSLRHGIGVSFAHHLARKIVLCIGEDHLGNAPRSLRGQVQVHGCWEVSDEGARAALSGRRDDVAQAALRPMLPSQNRDPSDRLLHRRPPARMRRCCLAPRVTLFRVTDRGLQWVVVHRGPGSPPTNTWSTSWLWRSRRTALNAARLPWISEMIAIFISGDRQTYSERPIAVPRGQPHMVAVLD